MVVLLKMMSSSLSAKFDANEKSCIFLVVFRLVTNYIELAFAAWWFQGEFCLITNFVQVIRPIVIFLFRWYLLLKSKSFDQMKCLSRKLFWFKSHNHNRSVLFLKYPYQCPGVLSKCWASENTFSWMITWKFVSIQGRIGYMLIMNTVLHFQINSCEGEHNYSLSEHRENDEKSSDCHTGESVVMLRS